MKDNQWTISTDEENYNYELFDTKEEAIQAFKHELAISEYPKVTEQGCFWVGQVEHPSALEFFDVDNIIEMAQERACDDYSEWSENWLTNVRTEQREELQGLIAGWIDKNNLQPDFYGIKNTEKISLEE